MKEINALEFEKLSGYSLVDFSATWCGPCRMLKPILEKLDNEYENVNFYSIDVDNEPDLCAKLNINSVPFVIFMKDNEVVSSFTGFIPEKMIKNFIEKCMN